MDFPNWYILIISVMEAELSSLELVGFCGPARLNLDGLSILGIYFSAHWVPPAQNFSKKLISAYSTINDPFKKLEIIFVSFDRDSDSWDAYSEDMPWLRVPFSNMAQRVSLAKIFQVRDSFRLIILSPTFKIITNNGIEDVKSKGIECMDYWVSISGHISSFNSSPLCLKGHVTEYISPTDKIPCDICKFEIIVGWKCATCVLTICKLCQEWLCNSSSIEEEKLLCLNSHSLRRTEAVNNYYLKRFQTDKYTCRTCNKYPDGRGFHCRKCLFDICEECGEAISKYQGLQQCSKGHQITWTHDLCTKLQEEFHSCNFRCEICLDSYLGGGGFTCFECEYYCCVPCFKKLQVSI